MIPVRAAKIVFHLLRLAVDQETVFLIEQPIDFRGSSAPASIAHGLIFAVIEWHARGEFVVPFVAAFNKIFAKAPPAVAGEIVGAGGVQCQRGGGIRADITFEWFLNLFGCARGVGVMPSIVFFRKQNFQMLAQLRFIAGFVAGVRIKHVAGFVE